MKKFLFFNTKWFSVILSCLFILSFNFNCKNSDELLYGGVVGYAKFTNGESSCLKLTNNTDKTITALKGKYSVHDDFGTAKKSIILKFDSSSTLFRNKAETPFKILPHETIYLVYATVGVLYAFTGGDLNENIKGALLEPIDPHKMKTVWETTQIVYEN